MTRIPRPVFTGLCECKTQVSTNFFPTGLRSARVIFCPRKSSITFFDWYHVVTHYQGHVLSPSGLTKVAKNRQKKPKPPQRHVVRQFLIFFK